MFTYELNGTFYMRIHQLIIEYEWNHLSEFIMQFYQFCRRFQWKTKIESLSSIKQFNSQHPLCIKNHFIQFNSSIRAHTDKVFLVLAGRNESQVLFSARMFKASASITKGTWVS